MCLLTNIIFNADKTISIVKHSKHDLFPHLFKLVKRLCNNPAFITNVYSFTWITLVISPCGYE